jgi:hypothetical protein
VELSGEGGGGQTALEALGHVHGRGRRTVTCIVVVVLHARDVEGEFFAHDPQQPLQ